LQFQPTVRVDHVFRFQATAAGTSTIEIKDLGDLWCVAATAVTAYQLAESVRIRKIEMWGPPAATLAPVTVSIDWFGVTLGAAGSNARTSDTSVGATRVAHLSVMPPRSSQLSEWQPAVNTSLVFSLVYPANAIIDLHYSVMVREDGSAAAVTTAPVGATVGANYVRALDSASGTGNLPPLSYATI
jgi:hypothetical protein